MNLIAYITSDFQRMYKISIINILKSTINPSFHATILIRFAQFSPKCLFWLWRNILITKHGIDVGGGFYIGKYLRLPHPTGIVIGGGSKIGDFATIYQTVTIGKGKDGYPTIGNRVYIYPMSTVVGGIKIGDNVKIGAHNFIKSNVDSGVKIYGGGNRV